MQALRVGLIGCGWISEIAHMPSLAGLPQTEVVAIADMADERRAVGMRRFPKARTYRQAEALIADPDIDAVVIALPPTLNARLAPLACAGRKHVYLEKPLATSLAEGRLIVDAWKEAGTIAMIGYNFRRHPSVVAAHDAVTGGRLGDVISVHGHFTWAAAGVSGWRAVPGSGGGAVFDLASHHIDLVRFLTGQPVVEVSARLRSINNPGDTADVELVSKSGIVSNLHATSAAGRNANALLVMGTKGQMLIDILDQVPHPVLSGSPPQGRVGRMLGILPALHPKRRLGPAREASFAAAMADFVSACQRNTQLAPSPADGYRVLEVIDAAERSHAEGASRIRLGQEG